jgi:DNA primase catalytic core
MRTISASLKLTLSVPLLYAVAWIPCSSFTIQPYVTTYLRTTRSTGVTQELAAFATTDGLQSSNTRRTVKNSSNNSTGTSAYFIPPDQLEQIRHSADIVSVVESYSLPRFRRTGENQATCRCPFHDDNNPSMSIDRRRGIFKCFSCGAGGNVFNFVREYSKIQGEELSFYQTVRHVNDNFAGGLALQSGPDESFGGSERRAKRERVLQANLAASKFYEKALTSLPAGVARGHLRQRGMLADTVLNFCIGFAPESYFAGKQTGYRRWGDGSLVDHLRDLGFTAEEIFDAGLAIRTKKGQQQTANSTGEKS